MTVAEYTLEEKVAAWEAEYTLALDICWEEDACKGERDQDVNDCLHQCAEWLQAN